MRLWSSVSNGKFGLDQEQTMRTIVITHGVGDWRALVREVQNTGEPIALAMDGEVCGFLLPPQEIQRLATYYASQEQRQARQEVFERVEELPTYLDLLRADPTLVPVVDGQPLEFLTMMNSSFVDAQQLYQFRHPTTHETYLYWSKELQEAIGRPFARVELIPARPKDYVQGRP
jgi:hypothetical protein